MKKRFLTLILAGVLLVGGLTIPATAAEEMNAAKAWALLETYATGQKDIQRYFYVDFNSDGIPELVALRAVRQGTNIYVYYVSGGTVKVATGFKTSTKCGPGTNDKYVFWGSSGSVGSGSHVSLLQYENGAYGFETGYLDGRIMDEEVCSNYYDGNGVFKYLGGWDQPRKKEYRVDKISTYQLFAQPIEVVYVTNGGSDVPSYVGSNGGKIGSVPANPVREGFSFSGWYADEGLTVPWNFTYPIYYGLQLYAKWDKASSTAETVKDSSQSITLNGEKIDLDTIVLPADLNGGDVTYVRIRDMAALLDGTTAQFNVDWANGAIQVATNNAYTARNGAELQRVERADNTYKINTVPVLFDGQATSLESIILTDVHGGGHTYFKLRELGAAIGLRVDWSPEQGIFIETK